MNLFQGGSNYSLTGASRTVANALTNAMVRSSDDCVTQASVLQFVILECDDPDDFYATCMQLAQSSPSITPESCEVYRSGPMRETMNDLCRFGTIQQTAELNINATCLIETQDQIDELRSFLRDEMGRVQTAFQNLTIDTFLESLKERVGGSIPKQSVGAWGTFWGTRINQIIDVQVNLTKTLEIDIDIEFVNTMITSLSALQQISLTNRTVDSINQSVTVEVIADMIVGSGGPTSQATRDSIARLQAEYDALTQEAKRIEREYLEQQTGLGNQTAIVLVVLGVLVIAFLMLVLVIVVGK